MASIVIRLDPGLLKNPDADLRYEIPDLISERSGGLVEASGYDYEPDGNAMQIYLETSDIRSAIELIIQFLENEHLHGNDLSRGAQIGVNESESPVATEFTIVYPPGSSGVVLAPRVA
jgi:hypothetical protein